MTHLTEKEIREKLDPVCDAFEAALGRGERPMLTDLVLSAAPEIRSPLFTELLAIELEFRTQVGEVPRPAEYESRYPGFTAEIQGLFRKESATQREELLKTSDETGVSPETPSPATDSVMAKTMLAVGSDTVDDADDENASGEVEFRRFLQPSMRTGWLGQLGHYEIETILGRGAFGIVAKALDEKLHRVVAIKLMKPDLAATSPPRQRFLREARTAAAVSHENIVAIYGVEEQPIPYLVMEYVPGQTLQQRMDERGPFEVKDILRIGQQVAAGLAAAHSAKLIHRDIKPSNILLTRGPAERAKISDFGMARAVDDASMTQSGMIAGTPLYMAPEQALGEVLDHRADLFSLGSVLYQMASGRPPFRAANTPAVLKRVCQETPRPLHDVLPGIPGWLETVIFRLLEKQPDDRYQSSQELADLLARCQRELELNGKVTCVGESRRAEESLGFPPVKRTEPKAQRNPIGWLIGSVLAVAAVIGFALWNGGKKTPDLDTSISSNAPISSSPISSSPPEALATKPPETIGSQGRPTEVPNGDPPDSDASPLQDIAELGGRKAEGPKIAADGMALWFHASDDHGAGNRRLVLWQSWRQSTNEPFIAAVRVEDSINNQPDHNVTDVTLSADGLVLSFCRTKIGAGGNSDLWISTRPSGDASWPEPISLGPSVNTEHGEWEPELSPNGLELFFHSSRPSGNGGIDLWVSRRANREAEFGPAENLGPNVNSKDVEGGAALSGDGLTLMFNRFTPTGNGNGSLWRATRNSLDAAFEAPQRVKIALPANDWFFSVCLAASGEELYGIHRSKNGYTLAMSRLKPVGAVAAEKTSR